MNVVLISTYELGHQPFGLASPAAWLKAAGATVVCLDLTVQALDEQAVAQADLVAFYLPMHTATRLALPVLRRVQRLNAAAHLCGYGLYAPMNETLLRGLGVATILGGEFEAALVALYHRLFTRSNNQANLSQPEPVVSRQRLQFYTPDRGDLPGLAAYAHLDMGDGERRMVGYTEASRGCKHLCRHCPIVPVYQGQFRIVQRQVVLADIRNQVAAGAQHMTFGDPDFFNGSGHAIPLVQALHAEFPQLTYNVTIKVEHLLKHAVLLPILRHTGCLFVTSAVEAVEDRILAILDKGHTRADFMAVTALLRETGLTLSPTFVAFNPWISLTGYRDLLALIAKLDLIDQVAPIQYAIRLLIPQGSRLLELPEVQQLIGPFDEQALVYPWRHPDARVDALQTAAVKLVQQAEARTDTRQVIFAALWRLTNDFLQSAGEKPILSPVEIAAGNTYARAIPHLSEPWYC